MIFGINPKKFLIFCFLYEHVYGFLGCCDIVERIFILDTIVLKYQNWKFGSRIGKRAEMFEKLLLTMFL